MPNTEELEIGSETKLTPSEIAKALGKEGLKSLLRDPEVMKIRMTDPEIIKKEAALNEQTRLEEAQKIEDEIKRVGNLFNPPRVAPESLSKIGTTIKSGSATIYANFKREGRADVLKTYVSKNNLTDKQFERRCEMARMYMFAAVEALLEIKITLE